MAEYGSDFREKMRVWKTRMWFYSATKASLYVEGLASLQGDPETLAAMENSMFWARSMSHVPYWPLNQPKREMNVGACKGRGG